MKEKPLTEFINVNGENKRKEELRKEQKEVKGLWELPEGWKWVRLGYTAEIIMGQSPPSKTYNTKGIGLPFYQGKADFSEVHPVPKIWCSQPIKIAEKGDILISVRAPVGPVNIANEKCAIGRGLASIRPNKDFLNNWFLFYYLKYFEDKWIGFGSTFDAIRRRELQNLLVPLPPLEEQKHIVKKLDEIRSRVEEAKRLVREAREKAEQLMASALHEVFSKADERGWVWHHFDEIVNLKAKFKVGKLKKSEYQNEGLLPVIDQGENFIAGYTNNVELKYNGPLPVVIFGDHTTNVKYVDFPFVVGADGVKILVPKSNVYPKYLYYMLLKFKPKPEGYKRHFSKLKDKDRVYPVPSLEEQKRIVAYLDAVSERARQLIKLYEEREKELEKLWFSALDKAFKGKL